MLVQPHKGRKEQGDMPLSTPCDEIASHKIIPSAAPYSAIVFDPEEYLHFLSETDWTEAQKVEFTTAVWEIVVSFVDLAHGVHPIQQSQKSTLPDDSSDMLPLKKFSHIENKEIATASVRDAAGTES